MITRVFILNLKGGVYKATLVKGSTLCLPKYRGFKSTLRASGGQEFKIHLQCLSTFFLPSLTLQRWRTSLNNDIGCSLGEGGLKRGLVVGKKETEPVFNGHARWVGLAGNSSGFGVGFGATYCSQADGEGGKAARLASRLAKCSKWHRVGVFIGVLSSLRSDEAVLVPLED